MSDEENLFLRKKRNQSPLTERLKACFVITEEVFDPLVCVPARTPVHLYQTGLDDFFKLNSIRFVVLYDLSLFHRSVNFCEDAGNRVAGV